MQTKFQLERTPLCAGSQLSNEDDDGYSEAGEQFKPLHITITLLVPKKDRNGKVARKPDVVQKQFQLPGILGHNNPINPSMFWKTGLEALGPTYAATYTPGNDSGQWPVFKWRKDGAAVNKGLLIEMDSEFSSMIQSVMQQSMAPSALSVHPSSHLVGGYGCVNKAPNAADLTPLEAECAAKVVKLQERWPCIDTEHGGQYCYVRKPGEACVSLSPHALKHWASSWLEGSATLDHPPNTKYFDHTTHHRSKSQSQGPANPPGNNQLEALTTLALATFMSTLNPKASVASPDKSPTSPKKKAASQPPCSPQKTKPILTSSSIEKFVNWCDMARGEDWSACMSGMQAEDIYPDDHIEKISNDELRKALGLGLGSVHRFRAAASEFWKLEVKATSQSADPVTHDAPGSSLAGHKRKAPEDWVVVPYRRKYPDGGGEKQIHFRHYKDERTC
ncbi:uncharacterized protein EI90DRAFT_3128769 [Cantharellus anzutake]|uniref:uncharacterized protein n=1 Tax=Cantharellus anzutake TaxID=1750568 RepID=UPI001903FA91|nr:uncharacterized protein EI90DRAFT_3128769 [Cantharellus anzutake]KAF8325415.1 hypothetical protein EI90DRAFT_3128769 [Cantharellus anzutake]